MEKNVGVSKGCPWKRRRKLNEDVLNTDFLHTYSDIYNRMISKIDSENQITERITQALNHIDKERLILAPDCGLGHLSRELSKKKLKIMTQVAKKF